jgi:hypothetical protein
VKYRRLVSFGLFCLVIADTNAASLTSHFPAIGLGRFLAERFDLATIRSSLGPRRAPTLRTFTDFKMTTTKATDDVLEFESTDWFYQLRIVGRGDVNRDGIEDLEVCFTDQARGGSTYFSQQSLLITRYAPDGYAVALNYSVEACKDAPAQEKVQDVPPAASSMGDRNSF